MEEPKTDSIIVTINIEIEGTAYELEPEVAKELYTKLDKIFGVEPPKTNLPGNPAWPNMPSINPLDPPYKITCGSSISDFPDICKEKI